MPMVMSFCVNLTSSETVKPILPEDIAEPIPVVEMVEVAAIEEEVEEVVVYEEPEEELVVETVIEPEPEPELLLSREEIELIALLTMAEAEGECEYGQRLVIDTVLNRVDANYLGGDTVREIVYQPHQFSAMWGERVKRCYVTEELCKLVEEELQSRTNNDVMFFHAGKYGKYGTPMFSVGNHYFSSK